MGFNGMVTIEEAGGRSVDNPDATLVGRADTLGVGTQGFADDTVAAQRLLWAGIQLLVAELHVDGARGYVDDDDVAVF